MRSIFLSLVLISMISVSVLADDSVAENDNALPLDVRSSYFGGIEIWQGSDKYGIAGFGADKRLLEILSSTEKGMLLVKNVDANLVVGNIVNLLFAVGSGVLFGVAPFQDSSQNRIAFILGGLGSLSLGLSLSSIFTNTAYDNILSAVNEYNHNMIVR